MTQMGSGGLLALLLVPMGFCQNLGVNHQAIRCPVEIRKSRCTKMEILAGVIVDTFQVND
jgi:hypothetical protein